MSDYRDFLERKVALAQAFGFEIDPAEVNPLLFSHQRDAVVWAVAGGRRALFESFGLGKTIQQIEIARLIQARTCDPALIVLPLGVRHEFMRDGRRLGIDFQFIRSHDEMRAGQEFYLTNYESVRLGKVEPARFSMASLDEAAVLRSFGSDTFQEFVPLFASVPYRFVATATPDPNRHKELIHYSHFLGVLDSGQALTRFFQRNSEKAGDLTLYPHKRQEFFLWLASWSLWLQRPSDLGYSDEGYDLPPLEVLYHEVAVDHSTAGADRDGQGQLFRNSTLGVTAAARERRENLALRVDKVTHIVRSQRVHATLVSGEQGRAETTCATKVPIEPNSGDRAHKTMECAQPGEAKGDRSTLKAEASRETSDSESQLLSTQSPDPGTESRGQASALWSDTGDLPTDAGSAGLQVRDMPVADSHEADGAESAHRSLPQDPSGARPALPQMQRRTRYVPRQSGTPHESGGLPDQLVIWCDLNDEQRAVEQALASEGISYISLYGSQDIDERERLLEEWLSGRVTAFISKPTMYGAGVNMQRCHTMFFVGVSFKFFEFIQGIHRIYRFLQREACRVHIVHAESEREIVSNLREKWAQHNDQAAEMSALIREHGLSHARMANALTRSIGIERQEARGQHWLAVNNDCVEECRTMGEGSVDLVVTSIPFSNHYEYTPSYNDFGHTDNDEHFFTQMDFLTPELLRILKPGRLACVHVKDRILFGSVTGYGTPTVNPFHAKCIMHYQRHGFAFMGMITVVTDVVRENNQTYRLGWSEQCKDGTKMGVGSPEYVLLLRKLPTDRSRAYADEPVVKSKTDWVKLADGRVFRSDHPEYEEAANGAFGIVADRGPAYSRARWQVDAHAFWRSSGNRLLRAEELAELGPDKLAKRYTEQSTREIYDHEAHVGLGETLEGRGALPATFMAIAPGSHDPDVWHDVVRMRTLNGEQARRAVELHVCPLQLDIVERLIRRYSNAGETVFDPFGGLMTVPYVAVKQGRRGRGVELNNAYWRDGVRYLHEAEVERSAPSLFDCLEGPGQEVA